jgi:hypothetical protein
MIASPAHETSLGRDRAGRNTSFSAKRAGGNTQLGKTMGQPCDVGQPSPASILVHIGIRAWPLSAAQGSLLAGRLLDSAPEAEAEAHYGYLHEGVMRNYLSKIGTRAGHRACSPALTPSAASILGSEQDMAVSDLGRYRGRCAAPQQARKPQTGVFKTAGAGFGDAYDFSNSGISGREQDQFL